MLLELCFLLSLFWKNFVCTKAEKSHWVGLLVQENSIKIVIRLTGYFLLRPLMNEPFVSETWLPILEAVWVCMCVDRFACMCMCVWMLCRCVCEFVSVCKRYDPCHGFVDPFHEEGANPEWMRLAGWKEREEIRGHSRLCQFTVVAFSLRWDSSWPSSLLKEPFIYWKERKRKTYTHRTQNKV